MVDIPKYYWDACIWIEFITQSRPERVKQCMHVIDLAENGAAQIWTSAFTLAEVWKRKCDGDNVQLQQDKDRSFENYIEKEFITKVSVDADVGNLARRLLRKFPTLGKPQDAIHVATCLLNNLDELHTFDEDHLTRFDGRIPRMDHKKLVICAPPAPPEDPQDEMFTEGDD